MFPADAKRIAHLYPKPKLIQHWPTRRVGPGLEFPRSGDITVAQGNHAGLAGWSVSGTGTATGVTQSGAPFGGFVRLVTPGNNSTFEWRFDGSAASPAFGPVNVTDFDLCLLLRSDDFPGFDSSDFVVDVGQAGYTSLVRCRALATVQGQSLIPPHISLALGSMGPWRLVTLPMSGSSTTLGPVTKTSVQDLKVRMNDNSRVITVDIAWIGFVKKAPSHVYPNGVVSITFDDTRVSQLTDAAPVMTARGLTATAFAQTGVAAGQASGVDGQGTGTTADDVVDTVMSSTQLKELAEVHGWDIGFHNDDDSGLADLSYSAYAQTAVEGEIMRGMNKIKELGLPYAEGCAYVRGEWNFNNLHHGGAPGPGNGNFLELGQRIFKFCRTTSEGSAETLPPPDAYTLRAKTVDVSETPANILALVDEAIAERHWLILIFHTVLDSVALSKVAWTNNTFYETPDFETIMDGLVTRIGSGLKVDRVHEVLRKVGGPLQYDPDGVINK